MKDKLIKLNNTMRMIETKGESTKIMALCMQFVEDMIRELEVKEQVVE